MGIVGGLGVATNSEVLTEAFNQDQPIRVFGKDKSDGKAQAGGEQTDTPRTITLGTESLSASDLRKDVAFSLGDKTASASLDAQKAQALVNHFRGTDSVQSKLQEKLGEAETKINSALSSVKIPDGETLLTARVPFPSGEGSLVQVGDINLPVGLKKLALEDVPLVVTYEVDAVDTGMQVQLQEAHPDRASLPQGADSGLHLGAVRAEVNHPEKGKMSISGRVKVELDDGSATQKELEKTTDPARRAALEARLVQIEKIQKLTQDQGLDSVMDLLTQEREVEFAGTLQGKTERMGDGLVHAWLTPDSDGDQRADIQLSGEIYTTALKDFEVQMTRLEHTKEAKGGVGGFLTQKLDETIEGQALELAPRILDALKSTVNQKIQDRFRSELSKVESTLDEQLDQTLDALDTSGSEVGLGLQKVDIDQDGDLIASLNSRESMKDTLSPKITIDGGPKGVLNLDQVRATKSKVIPISARSQVRGQPEKPSVVIPGATARRFLGELLKKPEIQETFQELTTDARRQVEKQATKIPGPAGSVRVNVEVPFPSQENVESPLGEVPLLAKKTIPFTADYQIDDFGLALQLDVQPVQVEEAVRPESAKGNGVFLGAIRVGTQPMTSAVSGDVQLKKHQTKGGAEWAESALDEAFKGQEFGFDSQVSVGETESLFYVWVVPDHTGDGRADVAVAHRSVKNGADGLKIQLDAVKHTGKGSKKADLGGKLNSVVSEVLSDQMQKSGDRLSGTVSQLLEQKVAEFLGDGSNQMSQQINAHLAKAYSKMGDLEIPVPAEMAVPGGSFNLQLGQVKVQGDNIVSEYSNERIEALLGQGTAKKTGEQSVAPGEVQARLPGEVFNALLSDSTNGGPFDWNSMLGQATKSSSAIKELELAKDEDGKSIDPEIRMIDGKPTLAIQVDGQTNGIATPISAGARWLPGFVGDGLGWVSDNTVGALLGSRLQTEIQVPLEFAAQDGKLMVDTGQVKFATPKKTDFDIIDILPTRLLSSLITDGVASALGPDAVSELLAKADYKADLSDIGIELSRVEMQGEEGQVPNLTVGVTLGKNLSDVVSDKASDL